MTTRIRIYSFHDRFWHWLQAFVVLALLLTGLELHAPASVHVFGFETAVRIHVALGVLLVVHAFLGLFYHVTSGRIRQYLPEPAGFATQAFAQARYYLRGMFKGEPHPFARREGRTLNPLQQVAYLVILNVLLPVQVVTGLVTWGLQMFPGWGPLLGGLPVLIPIHTLGAWLFGAFVIMHLYLTTTGETPLAHMKAMVTGYETVPAKEEDDA